MNRGDEARIAQTFGGGERKVEQAVLIGGGSAPEVVRAEQAWQAADVQIRADGHGLDEVRILVVQPRQGSILVCERRHRGRLGTGERCLVRIGVAKEPACGRSAMQVVVQHSYDGLPLLRLRFLGGSESAGVGAHQVVQPVDLRSRLLHEMAVDQILQLLLRGAEAVAGERGHDVRVESCSWQQTQQPEGSSLTMIQLPQRHRERRVDVVRAGSQPVRQYADRPAGPVPQPCCRQPDRQRQPTAEPQHLCCRVRFVRHPVSRTTRVPEELDPVGVVEHLQRDRRDLVELDEPLAAGDQDRTGTGARQQRPDLLGRCRVVQQHEHPAICQLGPPARGQLFQAVGSARHGDLESGKQHP